jgi:type IV pilus assembly protein PilB
VRRICEHCKEPAHLTEHQEEELKKMFDAIPESEKKAYEVDGLKKIEIYQGKGCSECGNSGYRGRIAIYEVVEVNEEINTIITDQSAKEELIMEAAKHQNMLPMKADGVLKVLKGITTLSEIERVTEGELMVDEE